MIYQADIEFKDFKNFYGKFKAKPYYFLVTDCIHASYNSLRFRKNLLDRRKN